jgi:2-polyprenyl-3-methyl-5-hydroxy-6-metoxy-1,4-benzoquinol methylase
MYGCKHEKPAQTINTSPRDTYNKDTSWHNVEHPDHNQGRTAWQKPEAVIRKMGDISEKTIADIGAGTGYFAFRLALKAKKVIAIDIDPEALDTIQKFIPKLPEAYRQKIETRQAKVNDPMLESEEADLIVIINTIAYIPDPQTYLQRLKKGLKPGGEIMIVDYKMKNLPISAPPKSERIYLDVLEEMLEKTGYSHVQTDDTTLDYQYILKAVKP